MKDLNADEFRRLALQRLRPMPTDDDARAHGDHLLNPDFQGMGIDNVVWGRTGKVMRPAAVLIGIVERSEGLCMIFTRRTKKLKSHSGQVSFPGGKIDEGDINAQHAALRETHEEIGVRSQSIEILGQMPDYYSGSGYCISPVVGLIENEVEFTANRDEVEYIFEVPLEFLMNPQNHRVGSVIFDKVERYFYEITRAEHHIWGVTAGMVVMFYNRVFK